jgi:hypothetical protein
LLVALEQLDDLGLGLVGPMPGCVPGMVCPTRLVVIHQLLDDESRLGLARTVGEHRAQEVRYVGEVPLVDGVRVVQRYECLNEFVGVIEHLIQHEHELGEYRFP